MYIYLSNHASTLLINSPMVTFINLTYFPEIKGSNKNVHVVYNKSYHSTWVRWFSSVVTSYMTVFSVPPLRGIEPRALSSVFFLAQIMLTEIQYSSLILTNTNQSVTEYGQTAIPGVTLYDGSQNTAKQRPLGATLLRWVTEYGETATPGGHTLRWVT